MPRALATPSWSMARQAKRICVPSRKSLAAFKAKQALLAQRVARFAAIKDQPAITKDGVRITLDMNAGLLVDLPHLAESGADGIGLFRTELQFMLGQAMPRLVDQIAFYKKVFDAAAGKPVVFRTLDLGGDKVPSFGKRAREENPALGWRALRIALDRPALLRYQVRALIAAANGRLLKLLLPMVSAVSEFEAAKAQIEREVARARKLGHVMPKRIELGAMLEVPSLLFTLHQILQCADFVSVGSNDLLQFFFAADRTNPAMARRYDTLSPAVLSLVRHIGEAARGSKTEICFCGEMAGRPLEAMALIGLGISALSMQPSMIGPVKMMVRSLDTRALQPVVTSLCETGLPSARPALADFAAEHGIALEKPV